MLKEVYMKKLKGFYFDIKEDKDLLEFLETKGNQTNYIKELIRKDMKNVDISEIVRKEVNKYLRETAEQIKNIGAKNTDNNRQ
jgi:hypothetical protein